MADLSPAALISDPAYDRLKRTVIDATGLAYYQDKDDQLAERFGRRMQALGLGECSRYLDRLLDPAHRDGEFDFIIAELTIGETYFFRHREQFDALRDIVFPEIMERKRNDRRLRIWSAGCSNGAEAYSLSILLRSEMAMQTAGWNLEITGTDMNRQFLEQAKQGRYPEWAFRGVPEGLRRDCFRQTGKVWEILPPFRKGVSFRFHNLVNQPLPSVTDNLFDFDVIVCRNVLIYFTQPVAASTVARLGLCLGDGGWLVPGYAELGADLFGSMAAVPVPGATLYRKAPVSGPASLPAWTPISFPEDAKPEAPRGDSAVPPEQNKGPNPDIDSLRRLCDQGLLGEALGQCEKFIAADKMNADLHFRYSLILDALGLPSQAEQALKKTLYLDRDFVMAHYYLGVLQQKSHDGKNAMRSFRNVLDLLSRQDPAKVFAHADGATAADLAELARTNLESLEGK